MSEKINTLIEELDINEIIAIRRKKLEDLKESGNDPYEITKYDKTHSTNEVFENYQELEGKEISIAGRIVSKRVMGKASFCHLLDEKGQMQIYLRVDELGAEVYDEFKKLDIGDIIGVTGIVFTTHKGEKSIKAKSYIL